MTPRFAPGPWRERIATGTCDHMIRSDGARESVCVIPYKYGTPERRNSNAALIMAAPELYEACRRAAEHHQGASSEIGRLLRAALAEAEGRAARPPVDNDHVAPGCEPFDEATIRSSQAHMSGGPEKHAVCPECHRAELRDYLSTSAASAAKAAPEAVPPLRAGGKEEA